MISLSGLNRLILFFFIILYLSFSNFSFAEEEPADIWEDKSEKLGYSTQIIFNLKSRNIGVLITDHNVRETLSITDRSYLLFEGNILKSGSAREMTEDEEARRLYLGSKFRMDFTDA